MLEILNTHYQICLYELPTLRFYSNALNFIVICRHLIQFNIIFFYDFNDWSAISIIHEDFVVHSATASLLSASSLLPPIPSELWGFNMISRTAVGAFSNRICFLGLHNKLSDHIHLIVMILIPIRAKLAGSTPVPFSMIVSFSLTHRFQRFFYSKSQENWIIVGWERVPYPWVSNKSGIQRISWGQ